MCLKDLTCCFGSPEVDSPDRHRTSHENRRDEEGLNPKLLKLGDKGKHESPKRASDGSDSIFGSQSYPKDSNGRAAANSPREDNEGESTKKATQVSAFPENRGANSYTHPQETTPKDVRSRSPVKRDNGSSGGFPFESQPYPKETKFQTKADDDSEKRTPAKVGHNVIASSGDFKAKEQTKAIIDLY